MQLKPPILIFDFADPLVDKPSVQRLAFSNPDRVIVARTLDEVIPALNEVWAATQNGFYAAGMICYEAAPAFDAALKAHPSGVMPLLWFGLFRSTTELSPVNGKLAATTRWTSVTSREKYDNDIAKIRTAIERGDTYQVNYTIPLHASVDNQLSGDARAWYETLVAESHGQYNAYLDLGERQILSLSPELFFAWDGETIMGKPMKGTAARTNGQDRANILQHSEKDRAENLMIVDLLRNDLAHIAVTGSVEVPQLFTLETYPTVYQMTSTITANTKPDTSIIDIFRALFPCGSITGAPKIKTTEIIADLEQTPRGIYCGAIGFITPLSATKSGAVFNVPIRTLTIDAASSVAEMGVGGGVTWGSNADEEYAEALSKARFLRASENQFELLETLLLIDGEYAFLDRHLARLQEAAVHFAFDCNLDKVRAELERHAQQHTGQTRRVRLLVSCDGSMHIENTALQQSTPVWTKPEIEQPAVSVAFALSPVNSRHEFLYYKTTARSVYEHHTHPDAFDVLLWNERGEITEFIRGNVVVLLDGKWLTPPVHCGLLAGVLRAELLELGVIEEGVIHRDDLARAESIWFINSVRGWVRVAIASPEKY